ncbi:MAG TPA: Rid family detoxifying hydrolase [Anaerolineales bacterium]|nr:Rid family detoxifying hydrolase [Anaerolineales bacterium]
MDSSRREVLLPQNAPKPLGPYSHGVRTGRWVFCSGTIGNDPATGKLVPGGVEAETRQALTNLGNTLRAGGTSLANVIKTTVFLTDLGQFAVMNAAYATFFVTDPPARSTIQVAALPGGAAVEIEAVAIVPEAHGD